MRYRSIVGPACSTISSREYAWDKSVMPYIQSTAAFHPYDTNPAYQTWTVPNAYVSLKDEIYDEVGTDGHFRPCLHTLETNAFFGPEIRHRYYYGWGGNAYLQCIGHADITAALNKRLAPAIDMDAMADEALAFMLPRLNEGTSLINSLIELKDLRSMNPIPSLKRLRGRHLTLRRLAASSEERKQFAKELATRMNNAHLNASFGIVPLLADIFAIHDELVELALRLDQLKRNAGAVQQRHYKRVIPQSAGVPASREWVSEIRTAPGWVHPVRADYFAGGFRANPSLACGARWVKRPVYHATVRYLYTLPKMDSESEQVLALLDVLGVRLDPSIVWNAIRYSFIIDWIVDVGSFLRRFARDNYPIDTTILEFCHSYSWHKECSVRILYPDDTHPVVQDHPERFGPPQYRQYSEVYRGSRTYYNRTLAKPEIRSVQLRALKLRQGALAGSLLLARTTLGRANRYQADAAR